MAVFEPTLRSQQFDEGQFQTLCLGDLYQDIDDEEVNSAVHRATNGNSFAVPGPNPGEFNVIPPVRERTQLTRLARVLGALFHRGHEGDAIFFGVFENNRVIPTRSFVCGPEGVTEKFLKTSDVTWDYLAA